MKPLYYDRKGQPISFEEWGRTFQDSEARLVAEATLPGGSVISTVWLGLDHNLGRGRPAIFETMVFSDQDSEDDLDCERYSTEKEALAGHEAMVAKWSAKAKPT